MTGGAWGRGLGVFRSLYGGVVPVNSRHASYAAAEAGWLRARDVLAGEDAVKAAGDKYLPRLDSQTDEEFEAYVGRANFYNATGRTLEGYVGLMFRRPPLVQGGRAGASLEPRVNEFMGDVDMLGTTMVSYARMVAGEILTVGRGGSLVDWEDTAEERAYVAFYTAEQIINWRTERVNGRNALTMLALAEWVEDGGDVFEPVMVEQIRVVLLKVNAATGAGECEVELWRRGTDERRTWFLYDRLSPRRRGVPLPAIPFVFHGSRNLRAEVDAVPLADLIVINLDHYRLNADYKHGLHFTALPTAWVSGFERASVPKIGSTAVWVSETIGATAGYLEFVGAGLTTFENAMDRDERMLSMLGTRLLESERKVAETATAIELRQAGEQSVLAVMANVLSESLTQILRWVMWWESSEAVPDNIHRGEVLYAVNTDFGTSGMQSQELQAVVAAWQAGAMSQETMFDLFRHGAVLPEDRTNEEEARLIKAEAAARLALAARAGAGAGVAEVRN